MLHAVGAIIIQSYAAIACMLAFMLTLLLGKSPHSPRILVDGIQTVLVVSAAVHLWAAYGGSGAGDDTLEARLAKKIIMLGC